jgi:hypothetical protein
VSGNGQLWPTPTDTNGGELLFARSGSDATFTAVVGDPVPEPASLLLLGTGVAFVARRRSRRA